MKKFSLENKTALVTGGGSGIGRAICIALAEQGAKIHVLDFQEQKGQETVEMITEKQQQAKFWKCDVSDTEGTREIIDNIAAESHVDILVNNAGIAHIGNIENTSREDMDRLFKVNIIGVYNCSRAVIPYMVSKGGVIINMASIASTVAVADRFAYSMSKGAVLTMTYSLAKDYLQTGIRCNSISPARVHTPFVDGFIKENYPDNQEEMFESLSMAQPLGRMGNPEEVADLAVYLCSDEASFITGTDFPIDGGFIKLNG